MSVVNHLVSLLQIDNYKLLIEIMCSVIMLYGMFLLINASKWGFFWLAVQNVILFYIAIQNGLKILCVLEILFFIMNTEGFILWHYQKGLSELQRNIVYLLITIVGCGSIFILDKSSVSVMGGIQFAQLVLSIYGQYLVNNKKNGFMLWVIASVLMLIICYQTTMAVLFIATVISLILNVKGSIEFKQTV